jgi:hypothetical protein
MIVAIMTEMMCCWFTTAAATAAAKTGFRGGILQVVIQLTSIKWQ